MAFVAKDWRNEPEETTDLSAGALRDLEQRVYEAARTDVLSNELPFANTGLGSPGTADEAARADHVHPSSSGVLLPSGLWVPAAYDQNLAPALTLNWEYVVGFDLVPQRIDGLAFSVTNDPAAASVIRLGIRADTGSIQPGAPVWEEAVPYATFHANVPGFTLVEGIAYDHPGGLLWVSLTGQGWGAGTAPTVRGGTNSFAGFVRTWATAAGDPDTWALGAGDLVYAVQDGVTGALPEAFVAVNHAGSIVYFIKRA